MTQRLKIFAAVVVSGLLLLAGTLAMAAVWTGGVRVRVEEKRPDGDRIHLWLPAAVVPLGMKLLPAEEHRNVAARLQPWLPAIRALGEGLSRTSDAVLVEVQNEQEWVRIRKVGRSLMIDVDSEEESVHVSFPVRLLGWVAREFDSPTAALHRPPSS